MMHFLLIFKTGYFFSQKYAVAITKTANQNAGENLPSSTTAIATSKPLGNFPQKALTEPLDQRSSSFFVMVHP